MLVAPPEQLKTTIVSSIGGYPGCLQVTDLTIKHLVSFLRDQISEGKISTLCFPSFEKLYRRDQDTASNLEGSLSAMMEEGFAHASWEDQRMHVPVAKCLIVAALVHAYYRKYYTSWLESGFARRFIWLHYTLADSTVISKSIKNWEPIVLANGGAPTVPMTGVIPWDVTQKERDYICDEILNGCGQPGDSTPQVLLIKIFCVLKWHYRNNDKPSHDAMAVLKDLRVAMIIKESAKASL